MVNSVLKRFFRVVSFDFPEATLWRTVFCVGLALCLVPFQLKLLPFQFAFLSVSLVRFPGDLGMFLMLSALWRAN